MIRHTTTSLAICGLMFLDVTAAVEAKSPSQAMDVSGRGPVVVFESALGQAQANWKDVAQALAPCLTTVTYDRPGIGRSPLAEPNPPYWPPMWRSIFLPRCAPAAFAGPIF
jgi:hypothetical protein